jgi:hypothetical protein
VIDPGNSYTLEELTGGTIWAGELFLALPFLLGHLEPPKYRAICNNLALCAYQTA